MHRRILDDQAVLWRRLCERACFGTVDHERQEECVFSADGVELDLPKEENGHLLLRKGNSDFAMVDRQE